MIAQQAVHTLKRMVDYIFAPNKREAHAKIWVGLNLMYDLIRSGVVTLVFHKHGVNGWLYLGLTLICSVPFSVASFRLTIALIEQDAWRMLTYGLVSLISFYAPDAYIFIVSRHVPLSVYILFTTYLLISSVLMIREILKKT